MKLKALLVILIITAFLIFIWRVPKTSILCWTIYFGAKRH
jgi:hypothetical protein